MRAKDCHKKHTVGNNAKKQIAEQSGPSLDIVNESQINVFLKVDVAYILAYHVGVLTLPYNDQFRFINCNEYKTAERCTNHHMFVQ